MITPVDGRRPTYQWQDSGRISSFAAEQGRQFMPAWEDEEDQYDYEPQQTRFYRQRPMHMYGDEPISGAPMFDGYPAQQPLEPNMNGSFGLQGAMQPFGRGLPYDQ